MLTRSEIFPERDLPDSARLKAEALALAGRWQAQPGSFLRHYDCACEAEYKRCRQAEGVVMQHAQIGYRDLEKSCRAWREIHEACAAKRVRVDRYGICLDWSMGIPRELRKDATLGTGLVLDEPEDFLRLTEAAPVAPHFGDFVLGFPAAVENTQFALAAGSTSIGNLGQYFTFRLPGWDDEIETTRATLTALQLIAAQQREILVHSNLDDGFAALFTDLSSAIGAVLLEKHIVDDLIGARVSHCWGHHFTDPLRRMAFHLALAEVSSSQGTMIYGNTVAYRGGTAENYASLAGYLLTDIAGQKIAPTGHAVNPVPVSENERIPDIDEVIAAQLFAGRLIAHAEGFRPLLDHTAAQAIADRIVQGGRRFFSTALEGLQSAGIDVHDPFEMLLALRRIGARRLELAFGAGPQDAAAPRGRKPNVASPLVEEIEELAEHHLALVSEQHRRAIKAARPRVIIATTDVHEHGKLALERVLGELGACTIDGGVSVDADDLAQQALDSGAQAVMISTYNGIALEFFSALKGSLADADVPILIGGRLNQIPAGSNTSLPVDVGSELMALGAVVCREIGDALPTLVEISRRDT